MNCEEIRQSDTETRCTINRRGQLDVTSIGRLVNWMRRSLDVTTMGIVGKSTHSTVNNKIYSVTTKPEQFLCITLLLENIIAMNL